MLLIVVVFLIANYGIKNFLDSLNNINIIKINLKNKEDCPKNLYYFKTPLITQKIYIINFNQYAYIVIEKSCI